MNQLNLYDEIINKPALRYNLIKKSHYWFFHYYFSRHVKYKTADYQKEIFALTEDESITQAVIVAFRGSAKSTIVSLSYPIWSILGRLKKKYVIIASQTQDQARLILANIKSEFETNSFLIRDFQNFADQKKEWTKDSIVIPKYQARISVASINKGIRGSKHRFDRPDLIICDDIEDVNSVKTQEGRDNTYTWFTRTITPLGQKNTKIVLVGNLLHDDSLMVRLKNKYSMKNNPKHVFKEYPLINDNGVCLWPGKYATQQEIEDEKNTVGDYIAWQKEYLLKIMPDKDQVVKHEWLQYYNEIPELTKNNFKYVAISVDPAISEKNSADYTAIITAHVFGYGKKLVIYINPNPINKRMPFHQTIKELKKLYDYYKEQGIAVRVFSENVAFQKSIIQQLNSEGYKVEGFNALGDKRTRLSLTTPAIQNGQILFPVKGVDKLIAQMIGFGTEKYDDLVDSFSMLYSAVTQKQRRKPRAFKNKPPGF